MAGTKADIAQYRATAINTNGIGRVQANILMTRLGVKDFVIDASDQAVDTVRERFANAVDLLNQSAETVLNNNERSALNAMRDKLMTYGKTFDEVTALQARRDAIVAQMDELGPRLTNEIRELQRQAIGQAASNGPAGLNRPPVDGLKGLSDASQSIALARLEVFKFLLRNDNKYLTTANARFDDVERGLEAANTPGNATVINGMLEDVGR